MIKQTTNAISMLKKAYISVYIHARRADFRSSAASRAARVKTALAVLGGMLLAAAGSAGATDYDRTVTGRLTEESIKAEVSSGPAAELAGEVTISATGETGTGTNTSGFVIFDAKNGTGVDISSSSANVSISSDNGSVIIISSYKPDDKSSFDEDLAGSVKADANTGVKEYDGPYGLLLKSSNSDVELTAENGTVYIGSAFGDAVDIDGDNSGSFTIDANSINKRL